jgi:hypothetical protein
MQTLADPMKAQKGGKTLHEELFGILGRINKVRKSIDSDAVIISLNIPVVGCVLLEFIDSLSEHMVSPVEEILRASSTAFVSIDILTRIFVAMDPNRVGMICWQRTELKRTHRNSELGHQLTL